MNRFFVEKVMLPGATWNRWLRCAAVRISVLALAGAISWSGACQAEDPKLPAEDEAAPSAARISIVVAEHVLMHDGRIITWEDAEKILDSASQKGKILPQFYATIGGLAREEELRQRRWRIYERLYAEGKAEGMSIGSLSPRASQRLDRIRSKDDLAPNMEARMRGRVLDPQGQPLAGAEVFLLPDEHINGVYLRDGFNRNPLEEHLAVSDKEGRFELYIEPEETRLAAVHRSGFVLVDLEQVRDSGEVRLLPWATVSGKRPVDGEGARQSVSFTCYPKPGVSFHIYETEIDEHGAFEQKFVPPGDVIVSRTLAIGDGGSMSFPVVQFELAEGESQDVDLGPVPEDVKARLREGR